MRHENGPGIPMTDEHMNELVRELQPRQGTRQSLAGAPDLRLAYDIRHAYQDETEQDRHSLERVFLRLVGDQATGRPKIISLPRIDQQQERIAVMQTNTIPSISSRKIGWKRRLSVFAAILCTLVLVAGFFTIFSVAHTHSTTSVGAQTGAPPTPGPTNTPVSHAIQKAILTDSVGNHEGVGPGLSGIIPKSTFTIDQRISLFLIVEDNGGGTITAKWYADNRLYKSSSQYLPAVPAAASRTATPGPQRKSTPEPSSTVSPVECSFAITYAQPATGKVELYWKGQLAMTLFFVVKPKA